MSVGYTIKQLMQGINYSIIPSAFSFDIDTLFIKDVSSDSRVCGQDSMFVAVAGAKTDGHRFVEQSIQTGAKVVVVKKGSAGSQNYQHLDALVLEVENTSTVYAQIVANFYNNPAKEMSFIGVTGTNGKTTITYLVEELLTKFGIQVGVIGTVNNRYVNKHGERVIYSTSLTTPDAKIMQCLFREMVDNGVSHVVMEVSSHAISQSRIEGIEYDIAAFTNLSRDHLDYHGQMDDYFDAKSLLFTQFLKPDGVAIIPADHEQLAEGYLDKLTNVVSQKTIVKWGKADGSDVQLKDCTVQLSGNDFQVAVGDDKVLELTTNLVGRFNIDNLLVTLAICKEVGVDIAQLAENISGLKGAPGRIERIVDQHRLPQKQQVVFVDYAHTPDALQKLLNTLNSIPHNELIAVYGCGGDRDNGKRPVMGAVGAGIADVVIITNDNPRTEDPERILGHVTKGIRDGGMAIYDMTWLKKREPGDRGCVVIPERKEAIKAAVKIAGTKDIVAIAGKGHEPYQLTSQGKKFFDDRLEVLEILSSWTVDRVIEAIAGDFYGMDENSLLSEVVTDSRKVGEADIFVALKGETHDAHDFLEQAVKNGAGCLVVEKKAEVDCPQIVVEDTTMALGKLANHRRKQLATKRDDFVPKIIGLTGSSGKTTTKEMVAAILSTVWPEGPDYPEDNVLKTQGNFNNLIGLPLSLLPLSVHHRAAVLEMGMNAPGEIAILTKIAEPDVACILNAQSAHLEGLGTVDGVAKAKGELFENSGKDTVFIVNLDDERISKIAENYEQEKITFSLKKNVNGKSPDIWASAIESPEFGVLSYTLNLAGKEYDIQLNTLGEHNVANSLAATAICYAAGASPQNIVDGLAAYRPPDKRMECITTEKGYAIISDCYNANPSSMAAALKTLSTAQGKKIALLADMFELGDEAVNAHRQIGALCGELKIDRLLFTGQYGADVKKAATETGLKENQIIVFTDKDALHQYLTENKLNNELESGDVLLVKGSRGMKMETALPFFTS